MCLDYYRFRQLPLKLSFFLSLAKENQEAILSKLRQENKLLVELYAYCLMPNHFHLLVKQNHEAGISQFMRKAINSYSSYFNLAHKRSGPLLQGVFKAVRVETGEQLIHVSRYIHINPYVGHVVTRKKLSSYPWSSLMFYLDRTNSHFLNKEPVLSHFTSTEKYREFLLGEADYQRSRKKFEHLFLE